MHCRPFPQTHWLIYDRVNRMLPRRQPLVMSEVFAVIVGRSILHTRTKTTTNAKVSEEIGGIVGESIYICYKHNYYVLHFMPVTVNCVLFSREILGEIPRWY